MAPNVAARSKRQATYSPPRKGAAVATVTRPGAAGLLRERERSQRQLREAERLAQLGPWSWDVERDVVFCSRELYLMFGLEYPKSPDGEYGAEPVPRLDWVDLVPAEYRSRMIEFCDRLLAGGQTDKVEYPVPRGRSTRWMSTYAHVADIRGDVVTRVVGYTLDVTERKRTDERRRLAQRKLSHQQRVLERIARGEPLSRTLDGLCRYVEREYRPACCTVLLLDRAAGVLEHGACPSLPRAYSEAIDGLPVGEGIAACGTAAARGEIVVVEDVLSDPLTAAFADMGRRFNLGSVWSHPLRKASGEVLGTFAVYRSKRHKPSRAEIRAVTDIGNLAALAIERSHAEQTLQAAANFDSLTGLPNRAHFLELVNQQLQAAKQRVAVMFLEVDRFRQINDSLGHLAGERILAEVAERLRVVVGDEAILARFGDEQFTVMVSAADKRRVKSQADRVLQAIETPIRLDGGEFFLTASVGIATSSAKTLDAYGLVRDADAAMYAARAEGGGRQHAYDRRLRARAIDRLNKETELRRALERDELVVHYQPILSLAEGAWSGVEALVRWCHPTHGLLAPDSFIPLAEETGLIVPLGEKVLEMAIQQAKAWSQTLPEISIAVNASALQLARPRIASDLLGMIEQAHLSPQALLLEVTESVLMQELETARAALEQLTAAGMRVLIDDFGTGYSSLARLGELPITGLKIDRSFIAGLSVDPSVRQVVQAITDVARAYGLQVVAEGIENARALADVDLLGCQYAQGYHLGRPAAAPTIEAQLSTPPPFHFKLSRVSRSRLARS